VRSTVTNARPAIAAPNTTATADGDLCGDHRPAESRARAAAAETGVEATRGHRRRLARHAGTMLKCRTPNAPMAREIAITRASTPTGARPYATGGTLLQQGVEQ
jgi:hypothetical protein